jgi:hypothetical protein
MWVYLLAFSVFLASGCAGTREYCKRSPGPPSTPNPPDLAAGEYRITLFADCGSREGKSAPGRLHLMQTRARNGSSVAGETSRKVVRTPPLYGWTDLEFRQVGASICRDRFHPPPESRRPMWPGVLALDTEELLKIDPFRGRRSPFRRVAIPIARRTTTSTSAGYRRTRASAPSSMSIAPSRTTSTG